MEHVCSSRKDEYLIIDPEIPNSTHQEDEPPLFSGFPSPFFDNIDTIPNKSCNITGSPGPSDQSKRLKERSTHVGNKDRHSKIHTAQGLRDRRMRLSLHIARKFFDLQDLLGFDKASKTIEWLFCKSNKAIKEVAHNFDHKLTNQTMTDQEFGRMDWLWTNEIKVANKKPVEMIKTTKESRKRIQNSTRDQARQRARERTRERLMVKELQQSKCLFGGNYNNPSEDINKLGLGYMVSPNDQNIDELGYTSTPSDQPVQQQSSSRTRNPLFPDQPLALANNINVDIFKSYSGTPAYCTTLMNNNPPSTWLNSSYGFLGSPGGNNFIRECCNYEILPSTADPLTGDVYDQQNPSSFFMSNSTNFLHFQSPNQGK